jgi:glucose/arabinose dehydrogenase
VLASGLDMPSGLAFRDGTLYVAEVSRILRFRDVTRDLSRPPKPEVLSDAFPSDKHHGWKFIAFGPDGRLYVPVGAPCNICEPPGPLHATITGSTSPVGRRRSSPAVSAIPSGSTSSRDRRAVVHGQRPRHGSATISRPTS